MVSSLNYMAFIAQLVEQYTVTILVRCSIHLGSAGLVKLFSFLVFTIRVLELVDRTSLSFVDFNHKRSIRFSDSANKKKEQVVKGFTL